MAGTMLAAELLKDYLAGSETLSDSVSRALLQFFSPLGRGNCAAEYPGHPDCPMRVSSSQGWNI